MIIVGVVILVVIIGYLVLMDKSNNIGMDWECDNCAEKNTKRDTCSYCATEKRVK